MKNFMKFARDLGMSKKQRNKWCQQSAMIHLISLDISIPKSLAVTLYNTAHIPLG